MGVEPIATGTTIRYSTIELYPPNIIILNLQVEWDSNPRCTKHASFQDWYLKPLGHLPFIILF